MNAQRHISAIIAGLEAATEHGFEKWIIFESWLEAVELSLRMLPEHQAFHKRHGRLMQRHEEPPDAQEVWNRLETRFTAQHWPAVHDAFGNALAALIKAACGEWNDWLGGVFMQWGLASHWKGQFFTTWTIAALPAQVAAPAIAEQVHANIRAALTRTDNPGGQLALLGAALKPDSDYFFETVLPAALPFVEPVRLYEPAIGSGVMLLAIAAHLPDWMVALGLVTFAGQDIDQKCVWMSQIQFMLYGLRAEPARLA